MIQDELKARQYTDDEFGDYVRLTSMSDNGPDDFRRAKMLGFKPSVKVCPGAILRIPVSQVGEDVTFGLYVYCNGNVTVEDHVLIGPHCSVAAGNHKFDPATGYFSARTEKDYDNSIVIGWGSWLASNVTVTAGVKLGKCNLVCAGAVVTHSTPDYAIMAGIPAKQVGRIEPATGEYIWFNKK